VPASSRPDAPVGLIGRSLSIRLLRAKPTDGRHVSSFKYYVLIFNGCEVSQCAVKAVTGHAWRNDRTQPTQGPIESSKGFSRENSDRMRPVSGSTIAFCAQPLNTDRKLTSASDHSVTSVRLVFFSKKHFCDFVTFSTLAQIC
jgi:hypothetical protein